MHWNPTFVKPGLQLHLLLFQTVLAIAKHLVESGAWHEAPASNVPYGQEHPIYEIHILSPPH